MSTDSPEQRLVFDSVAELYDRARPGYPELLVRSLARRVREHRPRPLGAGFPLGRPDDPLREVPRGAAPGRLARGDRPCDLEEDSALRAALDAAYEKHAPALAGQAPMEWYGAAGPVAGLFADSGCFDPSEHGVFPWTQHYTTQQHLELVATFSAHRLLPDAQLEGLLGAIQAVIEAHGGEITLRYERHLHLARRLP